jgi:aromatic ring-opening dioxygenase LigB subunit
MPLVYAAITPHTPLLVPAVGREHLSQLTKTTDSFTHLAEDLYIAKPDVVIIISPHGPVPGSSFAINLSTAFTGNLEKFGDFGTKDEYMGEISLCHQIRESLESKQPLQMITEQVIDYGCYVPLKLLFSGQSEMPKVIPLYVSKGGLQEHYDFGIALQRELMVSDKRIAVIASGDLSHKLSTNSPGGYSAKAEKFDAKLVELLQKNKTKDILGLNEKTIAEVGECGLKPIAALLGILHGVNATPQRMSYEAPFGVGYLVMKFVF